MSVLLLANVGNSDLRLQNMKLLPDRPDPRWWDSTRHLGEEVRNNLDRYASALHMPLIAPTLNWLVKHEQASGKDIQVVLFASDQNREFAGEENWLKDTAPFAEVIQALLTREPFEIPKKQIWIRRIDGNPADYSNMLSFYSRELSRLKEKGFVEEDTHPYMEVSGGTPAMTSMLIVTGVEVFGPRIKTLYVDRDATVPYEVSVAQELFARKTRDTLCHQIDLWAYAVAKQTLQQSGSMITPDEQRRRVLSALLDYADRRLAFDFTRAREALQEARGLTTGTPQAQIHHWLRQMEDPSASDHLSELIHSTAIKLGLGDYADFVQRIFRFQEAAFRYMVEEVGIQYADDREQQVSMAWIKAQPGLDQFLNTYIDPQTGHVTPIDLRRPLNRFSLGAIVDYFVQKDPKRASWKEAVEKLYTLSTVADLRNKGLSGHGFKGIGRADLEEAFGDSVEALMEQVREIYTALFGHLPDDPYKAINQLVRDLIQGKG